MKLEQPDIPLLFSQTNIPDIFFTDYLSQIPGDYLKVYLYISFLAKYKKDAKLTDLSKKLDIPLKTINDSTYFLEKLGLITKKENGYILSNLQEITLHKLYKLNLTASPEKIAEISKNKSRAKAIEHINNKYFQGIMGPSWYNDIDLWFSSYNFEEQVMIALFDYCFNRSALHPNYVKKVAEAWGTNNIKTFTDLESYYQKQEKIDKIIKTIAKKLGRYNGLSEYEKAYIETWVFDYGYELNIIEIALKRTTLKQSPSFEYINSSIKDWHERKLTTEEEILAYIEQRKKQIKEMKSYQKDNSKQTFDQRNYENLEFLYANNSNN